MPLAANSEELLGLLSAVELSILLDSGKDDTHWMQSRMSQLQQWIEIRERDTNMCS